MPLGHGLCAYSSFRLPTFLIIYSFTYLVEMLPLSYRLSAILPVSSLLRDYSSLLPCLVSSYLNSVFFWLHDYLFVHNQLNYSRECLNRPYDYYLFLSVYPRIPKLSTPWKLMSPLYSPNTFSSYIYQSNIHNTSVSVFLSIRDKY